MASITSVKGRVLYNSRGSKTIEVDVCAGRHAGRVCAPFGASVGMHEVAGFPKGGPEQSIRMLHGNADMFVGLDPSDMAAVHAALRELDETPDYSEIGGALAFAVSIASAEAAAASQGRHLFQALAEPGVQLRFPYPLGNILGGGAHAGPGTPDIQEILVCATGARSITDAIEMNLAVHRELRTVLEGKDPGFTNGRGDEGGWAPRMGNEESLEAAAQACESLGYTLGREVSLGVDFASSTQWDAGRQKYVYDRAGFENSPGEQVDFAADIIDRFRLIYAEDAVHEEAFADMAELASRFPGVLITGDDLTVTNKSMVAKAVEYGSCSAAILKVNQAGSLYDAMEFARVCRDNGIGLITSHRSGESSDSHISHIGVATGSKMLKVGVVGGERIAKLNELLRMAEYDLIRGMAEV